MNAGGARGAGTGLRPGGCRLRTCSGCPRWRDDARPVQGATYRSFGSRPRSHAEELLARRFASFRTIYLPAAGELRERGFELLATGQRPHYTVRLRRADDRELEELLAALGTARLVPAGDGTIVHLRLLPGLVDDYRALVNRALAS